MELSKPTVQYLNILSILLASMLVFVAMANQAGFQSCKYSMWGNFKNPRTKYLSNLYNYDFNDILVVESSIYLSVNSTNHYNLI